MPDASPTRNITIACTGASGAVFTREILRQLETDNRIGTVNLAISDGGMRVLAEELQIKGRSGLVQQLLQVDSRKIKLLENEDIGACIASGSYPTDAMIVIPCSMGTLARIANGMAINLIERAADVCLKEQRPLVLCVRETPLNKVHIRNMQLAADAGAVIYPIAPTFYDAPCDSSEMARQFVMRVLAFLKLDQPGMYRWKY